MWQPAMFRKSGGLPSSNGRRDVFQIGPALRYPGQRFEDFTRAMLSEMRDLHRELYMARAMTRLADGEDRTTH
jgi:hypothetical protein